MGKTDIQWTEWSTNPIRARRKGSTATKGGYNTGVGHHCVKISPGCRSCYASERQPRFGLPMYQDQRHAGVESFLHAPVLEEILSRKKPTKIFWCDMTDMFGEWVPNEWIAACFGVMAATPQHTHQVLTKRAHRLPKFFEWLGRKQPGGYPLHVQELERHLKEVAGIDAKGKSFEWPLANVHLGVSVEDQKRAEERIPFLLEAPAAVRWVSAEPLLEAVDLRRWMMSKKEREQRQGDAYWKFTRQAKAPPPSMADPAAYAQTLDWVVVGGESGNQARTFDVDWARRIVADCRAADVPAFVKQLGGAPFDSTGAWEGRDVIPLHGPDFSEWCDASFAVREFPR